MPSDAQERSEAAGERLELIRERFETALFEMKRVIVGQDHMLERVLMGLLSNGHLLIEGVPGLAKTLTVRTLAQVLGGSFGRVQFTPDLVPSDLVGTRVLRPDASGFDIELGPVFCNFLLADEINRAPAKVQSALLEVMQERQVTIGGKTFEVPEPFLVMATQNPIESEGTYPLPEAQIDRFMMKVVVGYPAFSEETAVVDRSLVRPPDLRKIVDVADLLGFRESIRDVYVDPKVKEYAVALVLGTREPQRFGLQDLKPYIAYGASPRGSINLVHAGRALAVLRGRSYLLPGDVRDVAHDVLRHRIVPSYEAFADDVDADAVLDELVAAVPMPEVELAEKAG